MRPSYRSFISLALVSFVLFAVSGMARAAAKDSADSMVITFKDGHQQTISVADIARIEFKSGAPAAAKNTTTSVEVPDRHRFVGTWTVGDGQGRHFHFTFDDNGQATNDVSGSGHGTWTYVDGEAHVTWDNGWHDAIRKVGMKFQKFAYAPGTSFSGTPSNVTAAEKTNAEPI